MLQDSKSHGDLHAFVQLPFVTVLGTFLFVPFSFWLKEGAGNREGECPTS